MGFLKIPFFIRKGRFFRRKTANWEKSGSWRKSYKRYRGGVSRINPKRGGGFIFRRGKEFAGTKFGEEGRKPLKTMKK
jgi:hypothetical protein